MEQWMSWKTSPDDFVEFEAQILHNSDSLNKEMYLLRERTVMARKKDAERKLSTHLYGKAI